MDLTVQNAESQVDNALIHLDRCDPIAKADRLDVIVGDVLAISFALDSSNQKRPVPTPSNSHPPFGHKTHADATVSVPFSVTKSHLEPAIYPILRTRPSDRKRLDF